MDPVELANIQSSDPKPVQSLKPMKQSVACRRHSVSGETQTISSSPVSALDFTKLVPDKSKGKEEDEEDESTMTEEANSAATSSDTSSPPAAKTGSGRRASLLIRRSPKSPESKSPKKPPLELGIDPVRPHPTLHNTNKSVISTFKKRLTEGPVDTDGHGFVYMYRLRNDADPNYRKIGETKNFPDRRVKAWDKDAVTVKTWLVRRRKLAEKLVHWLLDVARVYRFKYGVTPEGNEMFITYYKNLNKDKTRKYVDDENARLLRSRYGIEPPEPRGKNQTEWFRIDEAVAKEIVQKVATAVNLHWKEEPFDETLANLK